MVAMTLRPELQISMSMQALSTLHIFILDLSMGRCLDCLLLSVKSNLENVKSVRFPVVFAAIRMKMHLTGGGDVWFDPAANSFYVLINWFQSLKQRLHRFSSHYAQWRINQTKQ